MLIFRDPVFGSIEFEDYEKDILLLPELQRLKFIKQNSALYLVYPGAHHTRFEHTLGVCHLATKIFTGIQNKFDLNATQSEINQWKKDLRLAALLHDIGHGPLAHLYEMMLNRNSILTKDLPKIFNNSPDYINPDLHKNVKIHEWLSCHKILNSENIGNIIEGSDLEKISKMAIGDYRNEQTDAKFWWIYEIIASEFDADRLEYLTRDSHFTGASYGQIDLDRIIDSTFIIPEKDKPNRRLLVDYVKGLASVECGLIARAQMYPYVYLHSTARAATAMMFRSFDYIYENEPDKNKFIENTSKMVDYEFILYLRKEEQKLGLSFMESVFWRDVFKKIKGEYKYIKWFKLHPEVREELESISNKDNKFKILKDCEKKFEDIFMENNKSIITEDFPNPIIIDIPPFPPLEELMTKISMDNDEVRTITEVSKLAWILRDVVRDNWNMFIFCHPKFNPLKYIDIFIEDYFTSNGSGEGADIIKDVVRQNSSI